MPKPTIFNFIGFFLLIIVSIWIFGERGRLMRPSTRRWLKEGGRRYFLSGAFFHAYAYIRWSNQYIGYFMKRTFPRLDPYDGDDHWANHYHGKVMPLDLARRLITVEEDICIPDLDRVIPYDMARTLVLQSSPDIAIYECPCRSAQEQPCLPIDVCMIVGQPFVDFIVEHNPHTARRVSQAEALDILEAEHERGHIHTAYFKDVMLDRFYAICNCCGCCCGGMRSMQRGVPMLASSGYIAQVNLADCAGCGICEESCAFDAITIGEEASINWEKCMGCGVCVNACPDENISLVADRRKGLPLDVRHLS